MYGLPEMADGSAENVEFVTQLGYMPVKQESFDVYLPKALEGIQDPMYRSLYEAFLKTQEEYEFYTAPQRPDYLKLETDFEHDIRENLDMFRKRILRNHRRRSGTAGMEGA